MEFNISSAEKIDEVAGRFLEAIGDRNTIAFYAPMGAGKTTFIAALCRALGVKDDINSPTFSIVNEYLDAKSNTIYHFDCYRLESTEEALDMGAETYLDSGRLCLIEWPETLEPLLPEDTLRVDITVNEDQSRSVLLHD
ncbi:MAG: tRNA (adenosine(37)-N6)-threonylcarbamoyltransferase complex ATPase subunit type 1 TsaE [Muribaculum sp.]|nr:tRNA (adenosine(37)-N6)-threonylcarbamoyltransferase complex ATPase subunit type 1 TsaE [Muribaculum sp.]